MRIGQVSIVVWWGIGRVAKMPLPVFLLLALWS